MYVHGFNFKKCILLSCWHLIQNVTSTELALALVKLHGLKQCIFISCWKIYVKKITEIHFVWRNTKLSYKSYINRSYMQLLMKSYFVIELFLSIFEKIPVVYNNENRKLNYYEYLCSICIVHCTVCSFSFNAVFQRRPLTVQLL